MAIDDGTKKHFSGHPIEGEYYTYADYLEWDDNIRYELIEGIPYAMSSPTISHQEVSAQITAQFVFYLRGKRCRVFAAPLDVRLYDNTVVQPDIVVICDPSKLTDNKNCMGAPDLVIEILSPSTSKVDKSYKKLLYEKAGVREYWIVDVNKKFVNVFILENGIYGSGTTYIDTVPVYVLEDFRINLTDVFEHLMW